MTFQMLLHSKARVNIRNRERRTALHFSAQSGNELVMMLLLESKANVEAVDLWQDTPLLIACKSRHGLVAQMLITAGSDIHATDRSQRTPLHYAIKNGLVVAARKLLEAGAMDMMDADSTTPLMEAVTAGHLELVRLLVAANFNVNVMGRVAPSGTGGSKDQLWCTPLEAALRCGQLAMADLLVMAGSSLETVRLWTGGQQPVPKEVLENDATMAWVHTALDRPLPLMAMARLTIRQCLGFWPQNKIEKLNPPKGLVSFLNYQTT